MNLRNLFSTAALAGLSVQAHPGHAPLSEGLAHFSGSPSHVLPALIVAAVLFGAAQRTQRRNVRVLARCAAVFAAAAGFLS